MGIRKLLTYCHTEKNNCYEKVNLVHFAQKEQEGIELLVDFHNFFHSFGTKFVKELSNQAKNSYLRLMGAEYNNLDKQLCNMLTKLKNCNIKLRFYIDGGRGTNPEDIRQKMEVWKQRHCQEVDSLNDCLKVCRGAVDISHFDKNKYVRPVLFEIQVEASIKSCGLEIVHIPNGEADAVIVKDFLTRPNAYAILSNDSDFVVFKDSVLIPDILFDMNNDLQIASSNDIATPVSIICGVVTNRRLINSLNFSSPEELIEMSIIAGNDYTRPCLERGLYKRLNCRGIEDFAVVIRSYKRVENIQELSNEMTCNHAFKTAVEHSRNFYSLRSLDHGTAHKGYFTQLLEKGIQDGVYPSQLMAMHCNLYWHRLILEDTQPGHPCVEIALETLRACVYHMILPQHIQTVTEYGRTPHDKLKSYQVLAIQDQNIPRINQILPDEIFNNLRHFHYIVTHQEPENIETIWTEEYGRKDGFKFQLLRYFILLNWRKNLYLTKDEFLAICAVVYGGYENEDRYQCIQLCPSPRCVTIGNWFQSVYRVMYLFLSHLLFIHKEFPLPKEIFSSSVWIVFYYCVNHQELRAPSSNILQAVNSAGKEMRDITNEKCHIIKHIAEGCFPYGTDNR